MDDSGSPQTNTVVYGWLELSDCDWCDALRAWLNFRHELYSHLGIPASYELHAVHFASGRGRPTGTAWDTVKARRWKVMVDALRTINALPGVRVGAAFMNHTTGTHHATAKARTYAALVRHLDARLAAAAERGLIIMDGDGTDPTYRPAHRELKLATRWLIEDPMFQDSAPSQWCQMADFVAYAAYMHLARPRAKPWAWDWYHDLLAPGAITGAEPVNLRAT